MNKKQKIRLTSKGGAFLDILRKKDEENPPKEYENFHYILMLDEKTGNYMAIDKFTKEIIDFINGELIDREEQGGDKE